MRLWERLASLALVAVVDDLFFVVKIREAARQAGVAVDIVSAAQFRPALESHAAKEAILEAVIVDLNSAAALDVIGALRHDARVGSPAVIGFVSHVAADVISAARAAGCDQVLARSAFAKQLPEMLRKLTQGSGTRG